MSTEKNQNKLNKKPSVKATYRNEISHSQPEPRPYREPGLPDSVNDEKSNKNNKISVFNRLDFVNDDVGFHGGSQKRSGVRLALWTWLSAAVDTLVIVSITCFFMMSFAFLMKTSIFHIVREVFRSVSLVQFFSGCFLFCFWVYLVFMRAFNGATVGEMTCDLRLGKASQRLQNNYVFKVLFRTSLIMLTGIILLPLVSLLFKRDVAGDLSGIKIYSLI